MLPPNPEMLAHSQKLIHIIAKTIMEKGSISFADYMQMALYYPGLGYYSAGTTKFGREGDFITAPELTSLFSHTLANYIATTLPTLMASNNAAESNVQNLHRSRMVLQRGASERGEEVYTKYMTDAERACNNAAESFLSGISVLEFGAGSGTMAADILIRLADLDSLPARYFILEVSADLRARQQATLQQKCPELVPLVSWLDHLPTDFDGIILANEVIDAMPVHLCVWDNDTLQERHVDWQDEAFCWVDKPLSNPQLQAYLQPYLSDLPQPYLLEVNLASEPWLRTLAQCQRSGEVLLIDYGFSDHVLYHPQRYMGTLMCHYRHTAHDDPFLWPGLQDITTHVNFSALGRAAVAASFTVEEFETQANFLLNHGLLLLAENQTFTNENIAAQYEIGQTLKQLLLPTEMGELFKVMRLRKK